MHGISGTSVSEGKLGVDRDGDNLAMIYNVTPLSQEQLISLGISNYRYLNILGNPLLLFSPFAVCYSLLGFVVLVLHFVLTFVLVLVVLLQLLQLIISHKFSLMMYVQILLL